MSNVDQVTADPFEAATAAAVDDILAAIDATTQPAPEQGVAPGEGPGHGAIRLRDPAAAAERGTPHDDPGSDAAGPAVGHGTIRLRD